MNWPSWAFAIPVFLLSLHGQAATRLEWSEQPGYRTSTVQASGSGKVGFTEMAPGQTGVWFTNVLRGDAYLTNAVAHNGSGVALGDVDGDGWIDIYLCNLQGPNRLYRNLGGWRFEEMDIGPAACADQLSTGAVFADVDGNGTLDLLVNGIAAGTRLFLNDGRGHWTEMLDSGLSRTNSATSMALADIDGDGDLDLYVTPTISNLARNSILPCARPMPLWSTAICPSGQALRSWPIPSLRSLNFPARTRLRIMFCSKNTTAGLGPGRTINRLRFKSSMMPTMFDRPFN